MVGVTQDTTFNVFEDIMAEGKGIVGAIEDDSIPQLFIPKLVEYYKEGRFPFDELVKFYETGEIDKAFDESKDGTTVKPVVRFSE